MRTDVGTPLVGRDGISQQELVLASIRDTDAELELHVAEVSTQLRLATVRGVNATQPVPVDHEGGECQLLHLPQLFEWRDGAVDEDLIEPHEAGLGLGTDRLVCGVQAEAFPLAVEHHDGVTCLIVLDVELDERLLEDLTETEVRSALEDGPLRDPADDDLDRDHLDLQHVARSRVAFIDPQEDVGDPRERQQLGDPCAVRVGDDPLATKDLVTHTVAPGDVVLLDLAKDTRTPGALHLLGLARSDLSHDFTPKPVRGSASGLSHKKISWSRRFSSFTLKK